MHSDLAEDERAPLAELLARARNNAIERDVAHGGTAEEWCAMPLKKRLEEIAGEIEEAAHELGIRESDYA